MGLIKTVLQFKYVAMVLLMMGIPTISTAGQGDSIPPKELVQYIHDARQRGVNEAQIRRDAVASGWPATAIDQAIAYEKSGSRALGDSANASAAPAAFPPSPRERQPLAPAASSAPATETIGTHAAAAKGERALEDYRIGSGDTLQISVWKEPDASVPSVVVRPDGKITIPMLKDVEVAGLTPSETEKLITDGLGKYITDANVTVVIAAINSKKIYVIGAVRKEGTLSYTYGMTVMQALSEAGGLTDYAKHKKIYILRNEGGREYRLDFNYDEVVKGERMDQNIVLLPGDTLVIPH